MRRTLLPVLIAGLLATSCAATNATGSPGSTTGGSSETPAATAPTGGTTAPASPASPSGVPSPAASPSPSPSPSPSGVAAMSDAELADAHVNEIGRVLVMEYHKLADTNGRWENSLATFKAQLQELHDKGYRPISLSEFIDGTFPIPAGTSPVLLTFDDSYKEHMFFGPDGTTPDPNSAVGILEDMQRKDPTWRARGVFAFYWPAPFREPDRDLIKRKFQYLVDHGFDLSNHTYNHDDLSTLTDAQVQENLAKMEAEFNAMVPDYTIRSITLTQGIWPKNHALAMDGSWNGTSYHHDVAFLVGWMPTRSPHHKDFDPQSVMRVQAYEPEFRKWVDYLDEHPDERFVSDGDPTTVTYPKSFAEVAGDMGDQATRVYPDDAGDGGDGSGGAAPSPS